MADTSAKRIYDVLPRPSSPYHLDTALIFSSLSAKLFSGPITVSLDALDMMSNFGAADQLEIDLGTGFQSIKANMPFTYTFPTSDTVPLTLRAIYGTDTLLAHSLVVVVAPQRSARMTDPRVAIEGGGGDLIYYTNESCDRGSRNFIIFVGGYDPNNERSGRQVTLDKLQSFGVTDATSQ